MNKFVLTALVGCLFGILMLNVVSEDQFDTAINPVKDGQEADLGAKEMIDSKDEGFEDDLQQKGNAPNSDDADLDEGEVDKGDYDPKRYDIVR